jgi:hypothetical protein
MKKVIAIGLISALTGCSSWCDNVSWQNQDKCLTTVRVVRDVVIVTAVVATAGAAVYAVKKNGGGGGGSYSQPQYPGNCQHADEYASDGSICGNRSADSRSGGY